MRRVVLGVLCAWAGIVALAWWLADRRMDWALSHGYDQLPLMQTRDNVLLWGAAIPLGLFVSALFLGLMRFNSWSDNRPVGSGRLAAPGRQARAGDGGGEE